MSLVSGIKGLNSGLISGINADGNAGLRCRINACAVVNGSLLKDSVMSAAVDATAEVGGSVMITHIMSAAINAAAVVAGEFNAGPTTVTEAFAALKADTDGSVLAGAMDIGSKRPVHMVILDESDGGQDQIGTGHLDVINTAAPSYQDTADELGIDCVRGTISASGVMADNGTDWDIGDESSALIWIGEYTAIPTQFHILFSKGTTAGFNLRCHSGSGVRAYWVAGGGTKNGIVASDHYTGSGDHPNLVACLVVNDRVANTFRLHTNRGSSTSQAAATGTQTHANAAKIGQAGGLGSGSNAARHGMVVQFTGADAEGLTVTHLNNLLTYMYLDG